MRYPNLEWAIGLRGFTDETLANKVNIERSRFSRCKNGRREFAPHEKTRIAIALDYPVDWLFAEPRPPRSTSPSDGVTQTRATDCVEVKV